MSRCHALLALFVLVILFDVSGAQEARNSTDLKKLQGNWKVFTITSNGDPYAPADLTEIFHIARNRQTLLNARNSYEFTLNTAQKPWTMDLAVGGKQAVVRKGIVDVSSDGQKLRICFPMDPAKTRPTEFASEVGSGLRLMALERATDEEVETRVAAAMGKLGGQVNRDEAAPGRPVVHVLLPNNVATDADLVFLAALPRLRTLGLKFCQVTDAGLKALAGHQHLEWLDLAGCSRITDASFKEIASLKQLKKLNLAGCKGVTAKRLKDLAVLKQLESVDFRGTQVTSADAEELRQALPKCKISAK